MKTKNISLSILLLTSVVACKDAKKNSETRPDIKIEANNTKSDIILEKLQGSPKYTDASLKMVHPNTSEITTFGEIEFNFEIQNYALGKQTDSNMADLLANSDKGQHIHFILDNQPYSAHYEPSFKKALPKGTHFLVAFLSRSYHESVKNKNAFVAKKIVVGDEAPDEYKIEFNAPTLIYSRPKGEYSGKDTKNVLLDFYLLNTSLSENGNFVKATINGKVFKLTEWVPYIIKGLPKGEITINLELLNKDGNSIPGAFNEVARTVILKE